MVWDPQHVEIRNIVVSANKQTTWKTALADANLTKRLKFDGGAFPNVSKEFFSDIELAGKGHNWATQRVAISQSSAIQLPLLADDFLAGWCLGLVMHKVATVGAGAPYTHTFTFETSTNIAPVTTMYFQDSADLQYKLTDMVVADAEFSGGASGPVQISANLIGSGFKVDGAIAALPALAAVNYLLSSDASILIGPQGLATNIDSDRIKQWSVKISNGVEIHRAPGGGLYGTKAKIGLQRVTISLVIAVPDVDDIRTLFDNQTAQELQININSGASNQLKFKFPHVVLSAAPMGLDGQELIYQVEIDETAVLKDADPTNFMEATVINPQASYLVAA